MIFTEKISLQTEGQCDIIDITPQVEKQVAEAGINSGIVSLFVAGSTAGLSTIEFESGLLSDLKNKRRELITAIDSQAIEFYDKLRKKKGKAVAKVEQGITVLIERILPPMKKKVMGPRSPRIRKEVILNTSTRRPEGQWENTHTGNLDWQDIDVVLTIGLAIEGKEDQIEEAKT